MYAAEGIKRTFKAERGVFELANDTVFIIEEYSSQRSQAMARQLAVVSLICLVCSVVLIGYSVRKYFGLRRQTEELEEQAGHDTLTGALTTERFLQGCPKAYRGASGTEICGVLLGF